MTTIDRTTADDAVFAARLAGVEAADADPDGTIEKIARAISDADHAPEVGTSPPWDELFPEFQDHYRRLALAAIHALQAPAEFDPSAALRRCEALADYWVRAADEWEPTLADWQTTSRAQCRRMRAAAADLRAALAAPAVSSGGAE